MSSCDDNCSNPITIDIAVFRMKFPAFSNIIAFPDSVIQSYFDDATCMISDCDNPCYVLHGKCRVTALYLLTAHLLALSVLIADGQMPYLAANAHVDKVSVGLTPPPLRNQFWWWLSTTPYGMELLALLQIKAVGGFYIGGSPELKGFRKVGGWFC